MNFLDTLKKTSKVTESTTNHPKKIRAKRLAKMLCKEGQSVLKLAKEKGLQPMDKQAAGELGISRGYENSINGFTQMCRADNPDKVFNEFGVVYDRESQHYFDVKAIADSGKVQD